MAGVTRRFSFPFFPNREESDLPCHTHLPWKHKILLSVDANCGLLYNHQVRAFARKHEILTCMINRAFCSKKLSIAAKNIF